MNGYINVLYSGRYPDASAGAKRVLLYEKGLTELGIKVEVISLFSDKVGLLAYYIHLIFNPYLVFITVLKNKKPSSLVFVYGFGCITLLFIRFATWIKGQKMVVEVNEKPYSCYGSRLTELWFVKGFNLLFYTRIVLPLIDGFVVISNNLDEYIRDFKSKKSTIIQIPILIDPEPVKITDLEISLNRPFLLHAGALSDRKDGIIGVFEAFALVNQKSKNKLHFYLTDDVAPLPVLNKINEIIKNNGLSDLVHFVGRLSESELCYYQQECSMLILNKPDNEQNKYNFSTKLAEFLRLKKPVIFTPVGEMTKYLKDNVNAFEVPVDNPVFLADKIMLIIENDANAQQIALNGFSLVNAELNYLVHCRRLKHYFSDIVKQSFCQ